MSSSHQKRKVTVPTPTTTTATEKSSSKLIDVNEAKQVIYQIKDKISEKILSKPEMARKAALILSEWIKKNQK